MTRAEFSRWIRSEEATRQLDSALVETSRQMVMCSWCRAVIETGLEPARQELCADCQQRDRR